MKGKILLALLGIEFVASLFYGWAQYLLNGWAATEPGIFTGSPDASYNFHLVLEATDRGQGLLVGLWLGAIATVFALNGSSNSSEKRIHKRLALLVLVFPLIVLAGGGILTGITTR